MEARFKVSVEFGTTQLIHIRLGPFRAKFDI